MKVAVIGGGASGMMAAISAAQNGACVTLLEKNEKTGKKMYISGKGRCNFTNDCSVQEFLQNIVTNPRFLQGALHKLTPQNTMEFCEEYGLKCKVERGNRVFPVSDKSSDVIKVFNNALKNVGVSVRLNSEVLAVSSLDGRFCVETAFGKEFFDKVIVATGGFSYRATGCDGFGYKIAKKFGHTVVPLKSALCRILCRGTKSLEGLSLKNVEVSFCRNGKALASQFGEMLFTDDGMSGPAVLSLSSAVNKLACADAQLRVDLKPALNAETLDARVLRDFSERMNKNFENALDGLLPERLIAKVVEQCGIAPNKKVHQVTATERAKLVSTLKGLNFDFVGLDDVNNGIVTSGGVNVAEVNPATMESKLISGLYFAGETLDVDAYTGGFNMQIAFSTGFVAGKSAATS